MKLHIQVLLLLLSIPVFSFEINTHQAITQCALSTICSQKGSENLNYFALTMQLNNISYKNQIFDVGIRGGSSYLSYAKRNKGLGANGTKDNKAISFLGGKTYLKDAIDNNGNQLLDLKGEPTNLIDYSDTSYISLIEAGSILEDAVYPDEDFSGDGRFNNHFYSAQFTYPVEDGGLRHSNRALLGYSITGAYGQRTDNISWALDDTVQFRIGLFNNVRKNDYTLVDAFDYYKKSFAGAKTSRENNQAKLFVSLGHLIHLLEDLHSPAHVRNGPHAGGDYLEIFGRHNGGFLLRDGNLTGNKEIVEAVRTIDIKDIILMKNKYASYQHFFEGEARWVSENFFSEAHELTLREKQDFDTGEGIELNDDTCGGKSTTIFDTTRNAHPAILETTTEEVATVNSGSQFWNYIRSNGNNASPLKGDISNDTVIAFERRSSSSWIDKCRTMAAPNGFTTHTSKSYSDFDKKALRDTAKNVIPRAVASVQAFTNFFFRGRMEAYLSFDNDYIIVRNISDPDLVSFNNLLTFKADEPLKGARRSFKLFYKKDNDEYIPLYEKTYQDEDKNGYSLNTDMLVTIKGSDDTKNFKNKSAIYIGDILKEKGITINPGDNDKLILVFDGQIGEAYRILVDDYNLGMRGVSATFVKKSMIKKTEQAFSYQDHDDAWYQKGVPQYYIENPTSKPDEPFDVTNFDTKLDVVTGLLWQNTDEVVMKPWVSEEIWKEGASIKGDLNDVSGDTATTYCNTLSLGGHNDWRLPTSQELVSLVNYYFDDLPIDAPSEFQSFWSSDSTKNNGYTNTTALFVSFYGNVGINRTDKWKEGKVRCVRNNNQ